MSYLTLRQLIKTSRLPTELAEKLVGDLFKISREKLFLHGKKIRLSENYLMKYQKIEKAVLAGTPLQYALGHTYFYDREFRVNKSVLIPRPETELLVYSAVNFLRQQIANHKPLTIIDIGTGSGCIIISIYKESEKFIIHNSSFIIRFYATDISPAALKVARQNAKLHHANIKFFQSDLLDNSRLPKKFDLILANLPYLTKDETKKLKEEPQKALYGGKDGFELIEKLIKKLPERLNGLAIIEIGYNHGHKVKKLAEECELNAQVKKDLNGFNRYALITKRSHRV
jgi:release factor glutamine methyltransferase